MFRETVQLFLLQQKRLGCPEHKNLQCLAAVVHTGGTALLCETLGTEE